MKSYKKLITEIRSSGYHIAFHRSSSVDGKVVEYLTGYTKDKPNFHSDKSLAITFPTSIAAERRAKLLKLNKQYVSVVPASHKATDSIDW